LWKNDRGNEDERLFVTRSTSSVMQHICLISATKQDII